MAHPTWPLYDVVVRTPRIELRLATEDEFIALLAHASPEIYARTGVMPFATDWVGNAPESMRFFYRNRANWQADEWLFNAVVFVDGEPVGSQGVEAKQFGALRRVSTGSWLAPHVQGQGIGKEMRTAILHLAFAGLGALEAHSAAHVDNAASNAVSRALGYDFTHREGMLFGKERAEQWAMILRREDWEQHPLHQRNDITIEGLEPVLDWFIA